MTRIGPTQSGKVIIKIDLADAARFILAGIKAENPILADRSCETPQCPKIKVPTEYVFKPSA